MPDGSGLRLSLGPSEWAYVPIFQTLSENKTKFGLVKEYFSVGFES